MSLRLTVARPVARLAGALAGPGYRAALSYSVRVDDSAGWGSYTHREHERSLAEVQELYADTLEAWRKNPLAKRATDITTDFIIGDSITLTSPFKPLQAYIDAFWNHRKNQVGNRLEGMCNELTLAGDLFPILFLNRHDALSYLRFTVKDAIVGIETAANDWETELVYTEKPRQAGERPRRWYSPDHPSADSTDAIMLH